MGHPVAGGLVVHLDRIAFQVEELVAEDVSRSAADRLHADPHARVHHPVAPDAHVGLVVVDLDPVIDAVRNIIAKDVIPVGRARLGVD